MNILVTGSSAAEPAQRRPHLLHQRYAQISRPLAELGGYARDLDTILREIIQSVRGYQLSQSIAYGLLKQWSFAHQRDHFQLEAPGRIEFFKYLWQHPRVYGLVMDAERIRLSLDGGKPWNTFQVERAIYRHSYSQMTIGYLAFQAFVLALTLLLPLRQFYASGSGTLSRTCASCVGLSES